MNYKQQRNFALLTIVFIVVSSFGIAVLTPITAFLSNFVNYFLVFDTFSFFVINFIRLYFVLQFCLVCAALRTRFNALNGVFKSSISTKELKNVRAKSCSTVKLRKIYHILCDGIEIVNATLTPPFVLLMIIFLVS